MIPSSETLYNELIYQINETTKEKDLLFRSEKIVWLIETSLDRLKSLIRERGFSNEEEEILFYKNLLPRFHALYIYHATVFNTESDKPMGSSKSRNKYFRNELRIIENFFYHNADIYKYYRSGRSHKDKEYFTRRKELGGYMIDIAAPLIDRDLCTVHSLKISFLMAYEQLRTYFQQLMKEVEIPQQTLTFGPALTPLTWTDSKAGLIELIYALEAAGTFNDGKADLKQVTDYLQAVFHVELSNPSRTFQEILSRKKGYTTLLDRLKNVLIRRINKEDDE